MYQPPQSLIDRYRPLIYTFCAGLVVGMFAGWFFHGLVGTIVRVVFLIIMMIPFIAAFLFWRSLSGSRNRPVDRTDIEAAWRDVEPAPRDAEWRNRP